MNKGIWAHPSLCVQSQSSMLKMLCLPPFINHMKQLWQLTRHSNSFEIWTNLLPSSRGNLDKLRILPTEVLLRSFFDHSLLVLAPSQFLRFLWCLSSPLPVGVMWWDYGGFPGNGVAGTNVIFFSVMRKVPDLHSGDSIEVLEVVDTGGIFCAFSNLPFFSEELDI